MRDKLPHRGVRGQEGGRPMDQHVFGDDTLTATVRAQGAEPCSLHHALRGELLWGAGPPWTRHAPVLFPIVGRLAGDTLRHDGRALRMSQHGFARDRAFRFLEADRRSCRLELRDDDATRAAFPFPFRLEAAYAVDRGRFTATYAITNEGGAPLPASLGAHPAFRWPLVPGVARERHRLRFERPETGPVGRLHDGLLVAAPAPNPIEGDMLPLRDALFDDDALILLRPVSRALRFEADGADWHLAVSWDGFDTLGLWARRADFLCIEPWSGHADPVGFAGDFTDKPGVLHVPPGGTIERAYAVAVG